MTYSDYGAPTDPLSGPSLSAWAASVAAELDARKGVLTPATDWTDLGAGYAGMWVTRVGGLVIIDAALKRANSTLAVTGGTEYPLATAPTGFRPAHSVLGAAVVSLTGGTALSMARLRVDATGAVAWLPFATGSVSIGGWVTATIAYRGA